MALVVAVVWVQSLAWELPHATGAAKKRKKKEKKKLAEGYDGQRQLQRMNTDLKVVW